MLAWTILFLFSQFQGMQPLYQQQGNGNRPTEIRRYYSNEMHRQSRETLFVGQTHVDGMLYNMSALVRTNKGLIMGRREAKGFRTPIVAFRGVPYAAPPIGQLRFKSPEEHPTWRGIKLTTEYRDGCLSYLFDFAIGSEDCLYLNVFVPNHQAANAGRSDDKKHRLPVAVWVHGGGLTFGSELIPLLYRPTTFTDRGVIFVSLSYRLGPLGFLSYDDPVLPGNYGAKDVVMALEWIQKNIMAFGGDPSSVHLFGQSAGALLAHALSLSPSSTGMMKTTTLMSGSMLLVPALNPRGRPFANAVAKKLDCPWDSSTAMLSCLRQRGAKELTKAMSALQSNRFKIFGPAMAIVIDSYAKDPFMPYHPLEIIRSNRYQPVPLLLGTVQNELVFYSVAYLADQDARDGLIQDWDNNCMRVLHGLQGLTDSVPCKEDGARVCRRAKELYFGQVSSNDSDFADAVNQFAGEMLLVAPTYAAAILQAKLGAPVYYYSFEHSNEAMPQFAGILQTLMDWNLFPLVFRPGMRYNKPSFRHEQGHADELFLLFGLDGVPTGTPADRAAKRSLSSGLVSFWKSSRSQPSASRGLAWPLFKADAQEHLVITGSEPYVSKQRLSREKLELYADWYDAYTKRGFGYCNASGWPTSLPSSIRKMLFS